MFAFLLLFFHSFIPRSFSSLFKYQKRMGGIVLVIFPLPAGKVGKEKDDQANQEGIENYYVFC